MLRRSGLPQSELPDATPARVARSLRELLSGYRESPAGVCRTFPGDGFRDLVVVSPVPFASLCQHHVLPFTGTVSIGYLPAGRILGLSKFPRLVGVLSRRLQTQERLTRQLQESLEEALAPAGLAVIVRATHQCLSARGVREPGIITRTAAYAGRLRHDPELRRIFQQEVDHRAA